MRAVKLKIGITDQIHVYSNAETILLQLRRNIPSEREIGNPSFKVVMTKIFDFRSQEVMSDCDRTKVTLSFNPI